jgi:hypothetical protein
MSADSTEMDIQFYDAPLLRSVEAYPGTHENEVVRVRQALEVPVLRATRDIYEKLQPGRGWHNCGPTGIQTKDFIAAHTDVAKYSHDDAYNVRVIDALRYSGIEQIAVDVMIYDPRVVDAPGKPVDNTVLLYHTGVRNELMITEMVCALTSGDLIEPEGAFRTLILDTSRDDPDTELERHFGLYRFSEEKACELGLSEQRGDFSHMANLSQSS